MYLHVLSNKPNGFLAKNLRVDLSEAFKHRKQMDHNRDDERLILNNNINKLFKQNKKRCFMLSYFLSF